MTKKAESQAEISKRVAVQAADTPQDPILNNISELSTRVSRSTIAVIDTITSRGGFRGEELTTIGQLRDQCAQLQQMGEALAGQLAGQNG